MNRRLGVFVESRPREFLETVTEEAVPEKMLQYMVTMLLLSLVDDLDGQIAVIRKRISALQGVGDARLASGRSAALSYLEAQTQTLMEAKRSAR